MKREREREGGEGLYRVERERERRRGGVRDGYVRHLHSVNFSKLQQAGTAHTRTHTGPSSIIVVFYGGVLQRHQQHQQPDFHSDQNLSLTSFADPSPCLLARLQSTCPAAEERLWISSSVREEEGVEQSLVLGKEKKKKKNQTTLLAGWMCACGCLR